MKRYDYDSSSYCRPCPCCSNTKTLEQFRERKQSRLSIFRTLMSTRAQRLHREHVQALNMIDLVFYGRKLSIIRIRYQTKKEQTVTHAWKSYK
ncbi:DUF6680 family protein [Enterobacter sp. AC1]|uniref:DUF6680 family protein n=1 Tax=Enterobacter TaxID=547 RepID=UPI003D241896